MRRLPLVIVLSVLGGIGLSPPSHARADAGLTLAADWELNEAGSPPVAAVDAVAGRNGTPSRGVVGDGAAYTFDGVTGVVAIPGTGSSLDPGLNDFSFEVRVRVAKVPSAQVVDYDVFRGPGQGAYKMEILGKKNRTIAVGSCFFHGPDESGVIRKYTLNGTDNLVGGWHTIRCDKTATAASISIDGTREATAAFHSLSLVNPGGGALSIGAKAYSGGGDFFDGEIDYVKVWSGAASAPVTELPGPAVGVKVVSGSTTDTPISVTVRFGPPASGGTPGGYRVSAIDPANGTSATVTVGSLVGHAKIAGLVAGHLYQGQVVAFNASGDGPPASSATTAAAR